MSVTLHKNRGRKIIPQADLVKNDEERSSLLKQQQKETATSSNSSNKQLVNLETENRLSAILRLYTKGLNQEQIARAAYRPIYSK